MLPQPTVSPSVPTAVYRTPLAGRIWVGAFGTFWVSFTGWILVDSVRQGLWGPAALMLLLFVTPAVAIGSAAFRTRVVLCRDELHYCNGWRVNSVQRTDIAQFMLENQGSQGRVILLLPVAGESVRLSAVSGGPFGRAAKRRHAELTTWLES